LPQAAPKFPARLTTAAESAPAPEANCAAVANRQKVCQHLPTLLASKCRFHAPRTFLLKQRFKHLFMRFPLRFAQSGKNCETGFDSR
jgi:hypothetical protein